MFGWQALVAFEVAAVAAVGIGVVAVVDAPIAVVDAARAAVAVVAEAAVAAVAAGVAVAAVEPVVPVGDAAAAVGVAVGLSTSAAQVVVAAAAVSVGRCEEARARSPACQKKTRRLPPLNRWASSVIDPYRLRPSVLRIAPSIDRMSSHGHQGLGQYRLGVTFQRRRRQDPNLRAGSTTCRVALTTDRKQRALGQRGPYRFDVAPWRGNVPAAASRARPVPVEAAEVGVVESAEAAGAEVPEVVCPV